MYRSLVSRIAKEVNGVNVCAEYEYQCSVFFSLQAQAWGRWGGGFNSLLFAAIAVLELPMIMYSVFAGLST